MGTGLSWELADNFLLRGDVRYRGDTAPGQVKQSEVALANDLLVNLGFVVPLGDKPEAAAAPLASDDCAALAHAAALHDLGESDVPHDLVIGVAPMSHDDHATLFRHTEIGASVVEALDGTGALTTILRSHHERWDGQGYPNGLHREQIPRLARIFRVLDVSHTVTCARAAHAAPLIASSAGRAATDRSGLDPALASAFRAWVALAA